MKFKYKGICEGWAIPIHKAKDAVYRKYAELTLCKKCFNDWKEDHKHLRVGNIMTKEEYKQLALEAQLEKAQNEIIAEHNEIEAKRVVGKKVFMSYKSEKFVALVKAVREIE